MNPENKIQVTMLYFRMCLRLIFRLTGYWLKVKVKVKVNFPFNLNYFLSMCRLFFKFKVKVKVKVDVYSTLILISAYVGSY